MDRREWLQSTAGLVSASLGLPLLKATTRKETPSPLTIKALKVTPIALPDPPLLAASGCHGPYFLRNVVELETDAGIVGVGETLY